jgi:hypothetical protein
MLQFRKKNGENLRNGVALITTMAIISAISLIAMSSFDLMKNGYKHLEKIERINQNKIVINDIQQVLSNILGQIKDPEILADFMIPIPPIGDEDGRFELFLELSPYHTGININSILASQTKGTDQRKIKENYILLFERIGNSYELQDTELLLNYIADTLDSDVIERDLGTERVLTDPTRIQGFIPTEKEFREILKEYQSRVDDRNVLNVPWDHFFIFGDSNSETTVDCNFMKRDFAELLNLEVSESFLNDDLEGGFGEDMFNDISCDMIESENNAEIKKEFKISEFKPNSTYYINANLSYKTNAVSDSFKFVFDLKSKRIVELEIQ